MKNKIIKTLQISAVFIGTIVGAGLASGREITQFFTCFGYKSFMGILLCGLLYIVIGSMIVKISIKYNLNSYNQLIKLVSPGFLGEITDIITSFFLVSGAAIILAASGALLHQYFGISNWIGIIIMTFLTIIILLRDTQGLIEINTLIVPLLIIVIISIFVLYVLFSKDSFSVDMIKTVPYSKKYWFISTLLYSGFNIISSSGVIVPLSSETKNSKILILGITLGSIGLTLLCIIINAMLMLNVPYIYKYEIPLLYIANRFGKVIQIVLLAIIWLEMFSTAVSDVYSVGKTISNVFGINYKNAIFIILLIAIPISQIGFGTLISILYPAFGVISLLFIIQCTYFYFKYKV